MIPFREHGDSGPLVFVLHGGPAAAGSALELALGLADQFRVIEPWQRVSSAEPLTVARHVMDLRELIADLADNHPVAIVGESWGAMLALAYGGTFPDHLGPLVLVGCGTFDTESRSVIGETLRERMSDDLRHRLEKLPDEIADPLERMERRYELCRHLYEHDCDPPVADPQAPPFDIEAHSETWSDMIRLQAEGIFPAAFAPIKSPVLMLHGAHDPHPGGMIRDTLLPHIPHLEYHEWERCGHSPWRERRVRREFFDLMRRWLERHIKAQEATK